MKKAIPHWQMVGFIFTAVAGTLLHFLFDWSDSNVVVAVFSAVNESIWEHLKLLFYPMLLFGVFAYFFWGREVDSFWCIKLIGSLLGFFLIVTVYYTYTGALGVKADWFNIALFFMAAGVSYWVETKLFQREFQCKIGKSWAVFLIFMLIMMFTFFTFSPPHFPLFADPMAGTYGLQK